MTPILSFLTRNWGLKLLALILALIVFYGVRGSIHGRRAAGPHDAPSFFMKGSPDAAPAR